MVVVWILLALFVALFVLVPLIEKFGPRMSSDDLRKVSRWILPLCALLLLLQSLRYIF